MYFNFRTCILIDLHNSLILTVPNNLLFNYFLWYFRILCVCYVVGVILLIAVLIRLKYLWVIWLGLEFHAKLRFSSTFLNHLALTYLLLLAILSYYQLVPVVSLQLSFARWHSSRIGGGKGCTGADVEDVAVVDEHDVSGILHPLIHWQRTHAVDGFALANLFWVQVIERLVLFRTRLK